MPSKAQHMASRRRPRSRSSSRGLRWLWPSLLLVLLAVVGLSLSRRRSQPAPELRVGIVAGHWQYDAGAVCPDGLSEVDITLPVARRVAELLQAQGYQAEVLPEYYDRLGSYRALAFVSLHADSCIPELSGFKIAGRSSGPAGRESAALAESLRRAYAAFTGLAYHENTITHDMTQYHAFARLESHTPAAIVELGFMGGDRELLTARQDQAARGIAEGVLAFLRARPTPDSGGS